MLQERDGKIDSISF